MTGSHTLSLATQSLLCDLRSTRQPGCLEHEWTSGDRPAENAPKTQPEYVVTTNQRHCLRQQKSHSFNRRCQLGRSGMTVRRLATSP